MLNFVVVALVFNVAAATCNFAMTVHQYRAFLKETEARKRFYEEQFNFSEDKEAE